MRNLISCLVFAVVCLNAPSAFTQTDVDCPQPIIDRLESQFGAGVGTNPGDCQAWKHGLSENSELLNFPRGGNDPRCGFPQPPAPLTGQVVLVEPKDSVCDPVTDGSCPVVTGGTGRNDVPANRSLFGASGRIVNPFFSLRSAQALSNEGAIGLRVDCTGGPPANVDAAECGPGQSAIVWDDGFQTGDPGIDPLSDWQVQQNRVADALTEGNSVCCDSIDNVTCGIIAGFGEYPTLSRPLADTFKNRPGAAPFIFAGGRGTGFGTSQSYTIPGQLYGFCTNTPNLECNLTNLPASNPCPDVGETCNLAELGNRAGGADLLGDGSPSPGRCNHTRVRYGGAPVDPISGQSTGCALVEFFAAGTEGDPQGGCLVQNFGSYFRPDEDCDGIEDDTNGDGSPGPDKCPAIAESDFVSDANDDGIGDECQCGDANGDGAVTGVDIAGTALCANGAAPCDSTLVDADGDVSTTANDIGGVVALVNGALGTGDLSCLRNP